MPRLTLDDKRELCSQTVYLDGKPAKVSGARNDWATIYTLDGKSFAGFAWNRVERICREGGGMFAS